MCPRSSGTPPSTHREGVHVRGAGRPPAHGRSRRRCDRRDHRRCGVQPWPLFGPHGAAKAAQVHLVKCFALAWGRDGVRVCGVAPGPVLLPGGERGATEETVLGTIGEPADVCLAVRFCVESGFVTGTNVVVDGGRMLRPSRSASPGGLPRPASRARSRRPSPGPRAPAAAVAHRDAAGRTGRPATGSSRAPRSRARGSGPAFGIAHMQVLGEHGHERQVGRVGRARQARGGAPSRRRRARA